MLHNYVVVNKKTKHLHAHICHIVSACSRLHHLGALLVHCYIHTMNLSNDTFLRTYPDYYTTVIFETLPWGSHSHNN